MFERVFNVNITNDLTENIKESIKKLVKKEIQNIQKRKKKLIKMI